MDLLADQSVLHGLTVSIKAWNPPGQQQPPDRLGRSLHPRCLVQASAHLLDPPTSRARTPQASYQDLSEGLDKELRELIHEETDSVLDLDVTGTGGAQYWMSYASLLDSALKTHKSVLETLLDELDWEL